MENHRNNSLGICWSTIVVGSLLVACGFLLSCSQQTTPSLLTQIDTPAPLPTRPLSDLDIVRYGEAIKGKWGMRSLNAEWFNTGTQITLAGLSTATVAVASRGAGGSAAMGVTSAASFILQLFGIIKPGERDNAFNEGSGLILDAEGVYIRQMVAVGNTIIPTTQITPAGADLLTSINSAVKVTNALIAGLLPRVNDIQQAQGIVQPVAAKATIP